MQENVNEQLMTVNRIGLFCAASEQIDPMYMEKAEELGAWIGAQGKWLVYGGSNLGLMEATARAVKAHGGQVMGVVPTLLEERGRVSTLLDVTFPTVNLSDRKDVMLQESDVLVALPGGIGTLDEIFHVLAAGSIGYHDKQVILYNVGGFWDGLLDFLRTLKDRHFIHHPLDGRLKVAATFDELVSFLTD